MNVEEFEKATERELRAKANDCFSKLESTGSLDWAAHLLTAKFYLDEVERREDSKTAKRDLRLEWFAIALEIIVVVLIGFELLGSEQQLSIMKSLNTNASETTVALKSLNISASETATALKSVREAQEMLERSLKREEELQGRKPVLKVDIEFSQAIANKDPYDRNAITLFPDPEHESVYVTFSIRNIGNVPVIKPKAMITSLEGTVTFQCSKSPPNNEFGIKCMMDYPYDIAPVSQAGLWFDFSAQLGIPYPVEDFTIFFRLWGDNLKEVIKRTKVHVIRKSIKQD